MPTPPAATDFDDALRRLQRLEDAVFVKDLEGNFGGQVLADLQAQLLDLSSRLAAVELAGRGAGSQAWQEKELSHNAVEVQVASAAPVDEIEEQPAQPRAHSTRMSMAAAKAAESMGVYEEKHHHELQNSLWDSCIVLGLAKVGALGSLLLALGIFLSFTLQAMFCWLVFVSFLQPDEKYNLDHIRYWRIMYGHNVDYVDKGTGASLVSKVCNGQIFDREWWQHNLLEETSSYLESLDGPLNLSDPDSSSVTVGVALCGMAILIWAFYIATELQCSASYASALLQLPRGSTKLTQEGDRYRFESMSLSRLCVLTFIVSCRCTIAIILGIMGAYWLSLTKSVEDIVLNAAALLFILDIDELLYVVLAPKPTRSLISSIHPLDRGTKKSFQGIDIAAVLKIAFIAVGMPIFVGGVVYANEQEAFVVKEALCGGKLDFVYTSHPDLGVIFVADTPPYVAGQTDVFLPGVLPLVTELLKAYSPEGVKSYMWRGELPGKGKVALKYKTSAASVTEHKEKPVDEYSEATGFGREFDNLCEDADDEASWNYDWVWPAMRAITGEPRMTNCSFALPYCDKYHLPLVRITCPETCGCMDPVSGLETAWGCPRRCESEAKFEHLLGNASCRDFQADDAVRYAGWTRWWKQGFHARFASSWGATNPLIVYGTDPEPNCSFLEGLAAGDWQHRAICSSEHGRPASMFCPEQCGCFTDPDPVAYAALDYYLWCPRNCPNAAITSR